MEKPKKKGDRYFWIKLQDDFFSQEDIRYLRTLPSGSDIVIIYLELLCISLRQEGYVYLRGRYPTVEEEIAFLLSEDAQLVRLALAALENCKLITRGEQLDVYMEEFDCMVGSETAHARRKRDYRIRQQTLLALEEKHGTLSQACLTEVSPSSQQCLTEIEKEKELDLESEKEADASQQPAYGIHKNVFLSTAELESLKRDFPTDYQQRIDYFSSYMAENCKQYKNHYMTIVRWAKQDARKHPKAPTASKSSNKNMRPYSASDYYYDGEDSL